MAMTNLCARQVELPGRRADVFVASNPPYHVLRLHIKNGAVVDGISDGDLRFDNFDRDFQIAAPIDVIDFSNLSSLPPIYSVVSVDTSGCSSPAPSRRCSRTWAVGVERKRRRPLRSP